ncbi:hypothetical protein Pint_30548 [Pistacia integerrima]|uniref:Uncharacterized protein n=1 Tax=Pistacia integerrima TaxID=434235 RepID=A0ACC0WZ17_9ROSI|nr:hypothetical protein Pint_30548 [Pistacia integerrima]
MVGISWKWEWKKNSNDMEEGRLEIGMGNARALRRTQDGSEEWGYVEVRPKAHMFWWLCRSPYRVENPSKPWLIILWLQGGPGGSGVGIGNFEEVGPLDNYLKTRNSTWLRKADLLSVDNPMGTGYSYVEDSDSKLFVKTNVEAATDLTALLEELFNENEKLQKSSVHCGRVLWRKICSRSRIVCTKSYRRWKIKPQTWELMLEFLE